MSKTHFGGCVDGAKTHLGYVEMDPTGRYGRFRECLGKGAMKTVYKAFDEVLGMEVAWNQVKVNDIFKSPDDLQRLYSEVHLLKSLNHESIIRLYASWIDIHRRTFNFITELVTSGTLREYRKKYQHVDIRAIKNWARQILLGLVYLHEHDPPVIHRDLKCDNIFVNGHLGQVKIGDFGLAAILHHSHHAHSVIGTPEFMAPELYEEDYNELVDIYSFGMCVLEMLMSEYPYGECSNPAQIYKKVTSGKLPEAFFRIEDMEARKFVGKCLENVSKRLTAKELLHDSFLASFDVDLLPIPIILCQKSTAKGIEAEPVPHLRTDLTRNTNMLIRGALDPEDDTVFLNVQISDKDGHHARNIHFPFDIVNDSAISVALEMVKELEIEDWEPLEIAAMIEQEVSSLIPTWKDWGKSQHQHQHSFEYDEEDSDDTKHPFYTTSSCSSIPGFISSHERVARLDHTNIASSSHNWPREAEDLLSNEDSTSNSSLNYSCVSYENDSDMRFAGDSSSSCKAKTMKSSRFCPEESKNANQDQELDSKKHPRTIDEQKLTRRRSLVEFRGRSLRRSLMEICKGRLFNTVGAVENIGYQVPGEISSQESMKRRSKRKNFKIMTKS